MKPAAVFDQIAPDYDTQFGGPLARTYRQAVWRRLDRVFRPGMHVLEMGCGTGEDLAHLAARGVRVLGTDPSPGMLDVAREKTPAADLRPLAIEDIGDLLPAFRGSFDGGYSNFGGFNLAGDLAAAGRVLGELLKPGAPLVLCIMGRLVPWEWAWFLLRGRPGQAFRRLNPRGAMWRGVRVRYPTIGRVTGAFQPAFRRVRAAGLGVLLPPPYAEAWAARHGWLIETLNRWERAVESWPLVPAMGDHYVIELARR